MELSDSIQHLADGIIGFGFIIAAAIAAVVLLLKVFK